MIYREYAVHPLLQKYIKYFWSIEAAASPGMLLKDKVLPDGCMEMLFHYGDLYQEFNDGDEGIQQPRCFIYGQISRYIEIGPTGRIGMLAARFYPQGASAFFPVPMHELAETTTALRELCGGPGKELEEQVLNEDDNLQRIAFIENFLFRQLSLRKKQDPRIHASVQRIFEQNGQVNITSLATEMNLSTRQLERQFMAYTGLSAKDLCGIIRFQQVLTLSREKRIKNLTMLGHETGYYDQAHFIREFKKRSGLTPKEYFNREDASSHLFISPGQ